jgi:molecular chaperone GrpE
MTLKVNMEASQPEGKEAEAIIDSEGTDTENGESAGSAPDPLERAGENLKRAKEETAEWHDRFLRKAAEFENYRKRAEKDKTESLMLAKSSLILEFLPVADACERALSSMESIQDTSSGLERYREGVELLYKQLLDTFGRAGVVPIESEGQPFDPHLHEALSRKEDPNCEKDTVAQELRRGYLFKDRLLRPAQVIVAVSPAVSEGEKS